MGLPSQVQKQAEAAEQFDKKVAADTAAQPTDDSEAKPPAEESTKPEVTASPAEDLQRQVAELTARLNDENNPTFKARYASLQGMYNSQVPQLQLQVKQLTEQLAEMQRNPPAEAPTKEGNLVTKTDVEAFGEDLIDVVRRASREEIQRQAAVYEDRIAKLTSDLQAARKDVGDVATNQAQAQQERFFADLNARIPNWEQLQGTPECQEFLGSRIPGVGHEWNEALVDAANRFDIKRVTEIFGEFFRQYPKLAPRQPKQPAAQSNRAELERQVAPSKSSTGTPSQQQGKRLYSGAEYEQESMRIIRLSQQGKHDDAARLEAELNAALAEGRIRM